MMIVLQYLNLGFEFIVLSNLKKTLRFWWFLRVGDNIDSLIGTNSKDAEFTRLFADKWSLIKISYNSTSSNLVKFIASLTNSSLMQAFVEGSWMIMSKKNEVENRHMSAVLSLWDPCVWWDLTDKSFKSTGECEMVLTASLFNST